MRILFISHNLPFPPNKGEKVRSYHFLRFLSQRHSIILLALTRADGEEAYRSELEKLCEHVEIYPLNRWLSRIHAALCFFSPLPFTFGYFFSWKLRRDLDRLIKSKQIDLVFTYCSSSGQYAFRYPQIPRVIDFVDVDSEKWREFSKVSKFPNRSIFRLEHRRLREWERRMNQFFGASIVTTESERRRLQEIDPFGRDKICEVRNGVDLDYFCKRPATPINSKKIVFIGQLNYLPNVDAVLYFYLKIFPSIKRLEPNAVFQIVGRNPHPSIIEICKDAEVTGEVADVRPYLEQAAVFVAPFRLAFGVQTKILEAMASGVPVVASWLIMQGLDALPGKELLLENNPEKFAKRVLDLLSNPELATQIADRGRAYVEMNHSWEKNLEALDRILKSAAGQASMAELEHVGR